jgi:hypothetical protein
MIGEWGGRGSARRRQRKIGCRTLNHSGALVLSHRFIPEGGCGHVACRRSSGGATETGEPRRRSGRDIAAPTMGYRLSFPRLPGWRLAASLILPGPNCGMIALRGEKSLLVEFRHAACR